MARPTLRWGFLAEVRTARLGLLKERNFRLFYAGYATSLFGTGMAPVGVAFAVLDSGGSAAGLGLVLTAGVVAQILTLLAGGVAADRFGRRAVMLGSDAVRCAAQGGFAGVVLAGHPPLWALVALSAIGGAGTGMFNPGLIALTTEVAVGDRLHGANVLLGMAKNFGVFAGPAVAGALITVTSAGTVVAVDAASYAVSVISLALLRMGPAGGRGTDSMLAGLRAGWTAWRSRSWLWLTNLRTALFNLFVYAPFLVLGPAIAKARLGGAAPWGFILAGYGAGAVLAGFGLIGRRPARPLVVCHLVAAGWALPLAGLALGLPAPVVAAGAFVAGAGNAAGVSVWLTTLQHDVPRAVLARVSSYDFLVSYALGPIGYALAGPLAGVVGSGAVLGAGAVWQLAGSLIAVTLPPIRRARGPDG